MNAESPLFLHATSIAVNGRAALFIGPSGCGKSSLALQLIAIGATLVADDQCALFEKQERLFVERPSQLPPVIEARGIGLLNSPMSEPAEVILVVNMERVASERYPAAQHTEILGHQIKMIDKSDAPHFPSAVLLYLKQGIAT